jgi:hypothetical protein
MFQDWVETAWAVLKPMDTDSETISETLIQLHSHDSQVSHTDRLPTSEVNRRQGQFFM